MKNDLSKLEILTPSGFKKFKGLRRQEKETLAIEFESDAVKKIVVTVDHIFFNKEGAIEAGDLKVGDFLEHQEYDDVKIAKITNIGMQLVYDPIEVDDGNLYYSNYLTSHNCSFIGSSATLISSEYLEAFVITEPIETKYDGMFKIYEVPQEKASYVLGIDVAEGVGGDYSVIQVIKVMPGKRMEQVAVYANNLIKPYDFSQVIIAISDFYNEALMMIENNHGGMMVTSTIWYDYDIDRIINTDTRKGRRELGIRATSHTKYAGNSHLKRCVENQWLKIVDIKTIQELGTYEEIRAGIFKANSESGHDDHVMSLIWACYYTETLFYENKGSNELETKTIDQEYVLTACVFDDDDLNEYQPNGFDYMGDYSTPWDPRTGDGYGNFY